MTNNEFLLFDRIQKIKSIVNKYGENTFYISFSGGKDSTVLSKLVDIAIPDNKIPRVYADTGIEYNAVKEFVKKLKEKDDRIVILKPTKPIKQTLEKYGYPFKSKEHSMYVYIFKRNGKCATSERYLHPSESRKQFGCPQILRYQFTDEYKLKTSAKCCDKLKKEPMLKYSKDTGRKNVMVGILGDEKGQRNNARCISKRNGGIHFQPLVAVDKEWEEWFIEEYNIELCKVYYPPYNFERTGCKGCPYNINLQQDLDTMSMHEDMIAERKQCELIWKPVYDEYRRLGYRLRKNDGQMNIFDYILSNRK